MIKQMTKSQQSGFTLVELGVVIGVIAVLSVITMVGYGAWRQNIDTASAKSDLSGVMGGMEAARSWEDADGYPVFSENTAIDGTNDTSDIFEQSEGVSLTYRWGDADGYCVDASVSLGATTFYVNTFEKKAIQDGTCPVSPL